MSYHLIYTVECEGFQFFLIEGFLIPGFEDLGQNAWTYPHYDVTHKKTKPFSNFWKYMNYKTSCIFGGFEQLSNSIGWRVMVVQSSAKKGVCGSERVKV